MAVRQNPGSGQNKNQFISDQLDAFQELITQSAGILSNEIFAKFLDHVNIIDGVITNTDDNLQKVQLVDQAFKIFSETQGVKILTAFANDLTEIIALGKDYYITTIGQQAADLDIDQVIMKQLGFKGDGTVKSGGYMDNLLTDPRLQAEIKQIAFQQIARDQVGYQDLKKTISDYIEGTGNDPGAFYKHYQQFAFDTYSEVDRLNGKLHADKLKLNEFVYTGGTVKDSREFCIKHHGRVYSREEAQEWIKEVNKFEMRPGIRKPLIKVYTGPIMAKELASSYDPILNLGGIMCRHSADFISPETAKYLRSKQKPLPGDPGTPAPPVPGPTPPAAGESLQAVEDRIRPQDFESAAVYTPGGQQLFFKNGERSQVTFTQQETAVMPGNIFTHNHPMSRSFSQQDVGMFVHHKMEEIRAISRKYDYSLKAGDFAEQQKLYGWTVDDVVRIYDESKESVIYQGLQDIADGKRELAEAEANLHHEVMEAVAKYFKFTYTRTPIQ